MNTETTPVCLTTPHGPLHIAVMRAERRSYHDSERGNVTELRPMLSVATDLTFEADPHHPDHWTIRGRAYAVHYEIFFEDLTKIEYAAGFKGERWHRGGYTPYRGGFRNDKRHEVPYGTATFTAMWKATVAALDEFDAAHPGWMDLSRFLLLTGESDTAARKAAEARREAEKLDAQADALMNEANQHGSSVPPAVMALYTAKEN